MASSRLIGRLAAQAVVGAGAALAVVAWRAGLPANALLASVVAVAAAVWTAAQPRAADPAEAAAPPADAQRLDQERERRTLQAYLDQAPTPLVTLKPTGSLTAVNRAARRLFRTDAAVAEASGALHAAVQAATPAARGRVRLGAEGALRTYALSVAEVVSAGGALRLAALTDIQPEIQAAEAAALKELLQVLSHEIMNSLTPLASLAQSAVELLEEGTPQSVQLAQNSIGVVARRTEGLHRFVEAYRQLARLPDPAPRVVSLGGLLQDTVGVFEARWGAQGVELRLELPNPDVMVRLDPELTAQALLNLLGNAAEAAVSAGADRPSVSVAGRASGDGLVIVVEDNGAGVSPDFESQVFRPFFTTKAQGSGIGLSLAQQAISSQGGGLSLAPWSADRGARFTITL
jgi:two-component system nitrogen regulation sensor histidine kinase NtrY